jgi:cell division septal protein FtsQ|tara:strand:- start:16459 stop:16731 length:273 start_codon:yes stop_codon:yes gene_type:complete
MAKDKTKKLSSKELESIKDLQNRINTVVMNLGNAVIVQDQLTTSHVELQAEWKKETAKLEKKYGNVNISLEDGTVSEIKEEEAAAVLEKA